MRRLIALALGLSLAPAARAAENPGVTAAPVLQMPMGSRALGMGGAFTAVASDVSALYYNPAGLSRLNAHELAFTSVFGHTDDNILHFAYGAPLPFSGFSGNGYASAGASLLYSQNGTIEVNQTNPDGSLLVQGAQVDAGSDLVVTGAYSERVGSTPIELKEGSFGVSHYLGVSGKYIRSTLVQQYSASALTADAGYLVHSPEAGLSLGLSALNIGGRMKFVEQGDPLPTTFRGGLAYQGGPGSLNLYTVAADGEYILHEQQWHVNAGFEYLWLKSYAFRIGYQFHRDELGLTLGLGFRWKSRFLIDFAWAMSDALGNAYRVTLSYRFGGVSPTVRGKERQPFMERGAEREQPEIMEESIPATRPAPRQAPREEPPAGVPGWIY